MPNKLKDLSITKVAFVPAGDNPKANVMIFKSKEASTSTEPSPTPKGGEKSEGGAVKKFFSTIAKALGIGDESVDQAVDEIVKGNEATTFGEKMNERKLRRVADEMWDVCYALNDSLCSILFDEEVTSEEKNTLMAKSVDEFTSTIKDLIAAWAQSKAAKISKAEYPMTPIRLEIAESAKEKLDAIIVKAKKKENGEEDDTSLEDADSKKTKMKGDKEDMKIDKSKLTPEELAALEAIEKKAGIQEETPPAGSTATGVEKGTAAPAGAPAVPTATATPSPEGEDIYKGLHPAVKAELERLRKAADIAEDRELTEIAKKYEVIGKKPEELVKTFKSLKAAGGDAYDQMLAVLDASVEAVEKSGLFSEIGKKGNGESNAWTSIEKHADEIQKSMPNLTRSQAIDKACEQHPELVHEYESKRE